MINFKFGRGKVIKREKTFEERLAEMFEDSDLFELTFSQPNWESIGSGSSGIDYTEPHPAYNKKTHEKLKMKHYDKNNFNRNRNNTMFRGSRNVRGNTNSRSRH